MKKILLIDDEIEVQAWISDFLRNNGMHVEAYANGAQAGKKLREEKFDLIITDLNMPEEDGVSVIFKVKNVLRENRKTPIIVITGTVPDESTRLLMSDLKKLEIEVLNKPFTPEELLESVCAAFGISASEVGDLLPD